MTRKWLRDHLPAGWMEAIDRDDASTVATLRGELDYAAWCTEFGEAGYATPTWPAEYGAGLSLSPGEARFVNEVLNHYKVPRPFNIIGIGMGGPTVMAWGTASCATSSVNGSSAFRRSPTTPGSCPGARCRAPAEGKCDDHVVDPQARAVARPGATTPDEIVAAPRPRDG